MDIREHSPEIHPSGFIRYGSDVLYEPSFLTRIAEHCESNLKSSQQDASIIARI